MLQRQKQLWIDKILLLCIVIVIIIAATVMDRHNNQNLHHFDAWIVSNNSVAAIKAIMNLQDVSVFICMGLFTCIVTILIITIDLSDVYLGHSIIRKFQVELRQHHKSFWLSYNCSYVRKAEFAKPRYLANI